MVWTPCVLGKSGELPSPNRCVWSTLPTCLDRGNPAPLHRRRTLRNSTMPDATMRRLNQLIFCFCLTVLCWLLMMAFHEAGHVLGAYLTGGVVARVVLYPLSISRTDLAVNPHPLIVVWLGPIVGCLLPAFLLGVSRAWKRFPCGTLQFLTGFCLIANGGYIAGGAVARIGDCRQMLSLGTPLWSLWLFGGATVATGLCLWHRLGSIRKFLGDPDRVTWKQTAALLAILFLVVATETSG